MKIARLALAFAPLVLGSLPVAAHPGIGIVRDARGNVFYTDLARVWRIDAAGKRTVAVPNVHTHELALDPQGNLYGEHLWYEGEKTDKWGHRVWRRAPDGKVSDVFPPREGFLRDTSFVRDPSGAIYWVEREPRTVFRKRQADGKVATLAACGDCRNVRWSALAPDGTLLFTDAGDLRAVAPNGAIRTLAKGLQKARDLHALMGIWTDGKRNVYVADYGSRAVKRVGPDGRVAVIARSSLPWGPTGGLFAPDGSLWLLEASITNAVRVRRIAPDGKETVYK